MWQSAFTACSIKLFTFWRIKKVFHGVPGHVPSNQYWTWWMMEWSCQIKLSHTWMVENKLDIWMYPRTTWGKEHLEIWRYMNGHSQKRKKTGRYQQFSWHIFFPTAPRFGRVIERNKYLKTRHQSAANSTVSCLRVCPETYDLWYQTMPMIATTS